MNPPDYAEKIAEAMGDGRDAETACMLVGSSLPIASLKRRKEWPAKRGNGPLAYFRNRPHRDKPLAE